MPLHTRSLLTSSGDDRTSRWSSPIDTDVAIALVGYDAREIDASTGVAISTGDVDRFRVRVRPQFGRVDREHGLGRPCGRPDGVELE